MTLHYVYVMLIMYYSEISAKYLQIRDISWLISLLQTFALLFVSCAKRWPHMVTHDRKSYCEPLTRIGDWPEPEG